METVQNNTVQNANQSTEGRNMANVVYILYLVGFVTGLTALAGIVLAYANRNGSDPIANSHFKHQISIFWRGIIIFAVSFVMYLAISALSFVTMGIGAILYIVPVALGIYWFVWTLLRIIKGMNNLGRGAAIGTPPTVPTTNPIREERQEPKF